MLNIKDMPIDVDLLPKEARDFAIVLAQDGLIDDWSEVLMHLLSAICGAMNWRDYND